MQQLRTRFLPAIFLAVVFVFACAVGGLLKFGQYNPANAQAAAPETTPKGNLIPDTEFKFCCYYHGDKNLPFIVYHTRGNKPSAGGNATVPAIEQSYVFLPMPRLVKNNQNVSANSKGVNIEVEIELYPVDLSDEFLKQHRANVSTDVPLARVVPASLSTVALRVSPSYPALITFIPLLDPPVLPSRMKIEGKAPTADAAEKFVKDLQSGTARLLTAAQSVKFSHRLTRPVQSRFGSIGASVAGGRWRGGIPDATPPDRDTPGSASPRPSDDTSPPRPTGSDRGRSLAALPPTPDRASPSRTP